MAAATRCIIAIHVARGTATLLLMSSVTWDRRHLLQLEGLEASDIRMLLDQTSRLYESALDNGPRLDELAGATVANLFFEDSTRTRCSFTLAARRLGADVIDVTAAGSSISKGETIVDTAKNLLAMGVHAFVVRCAMAGGPHLIARAVNVPVINAGDGRHEHPTQGLLDLFTLREWLGDLAGRRLGIVGDIVNSRVARSAAHGMTTLGGHVILIGPPALTPRSFERIVAGPGSVSVMHELDQALPQLDAIMMLRVQFERAGTGPPLIAGDYRECYGLSRQRLARLPAHAKVLHPGPVNRGLELDSDVLDDLDRCVALEQVAAGVAVRMAVLRQLASPDRQRAG